MSNAKTIEQRLREDDINAFEEVYLRYKDEFINYARRFQLDEDELLDCYQDATIALHQNFVTQQKKLTSGSLKTYLFGIGKNKIYTRLKELNRFRVAEKETEAYEEITLEESPLSEKQQKLTRYFGELSHSCQELIKMFYYRNLSIKEIVQLTDYKDDNTVKSSKSRCMKRLSTLLKNN